jgi:hypothetical protein
MYLQGLAALHPVSKYYSTVTSYCMSCTAITGGHTWGTDKAENR